jgi:glycosyltransferase involved in cell wall biosynthesis
MASIIDNSLLLTIAIPTYNRAGYLDLCLQQICNQIKEYEDRIELIVSNNCSPDHTEDIVKKYIDAGYKIRYNKNPINNGERNFVTCLGLSRGKYMLIFGDDDVLLDGSLKKIMDLLSKDEYGIVYLKSYGYAVSYNTEKPKTLQNGYFVHTNLASFIEKVNYNFTFITGNIFNKSLIKTSIDFDKYDNTNMIQLSWIFEVLFNAKKNVYYNEFLVAAKIDNAGGYNLCRVFGTNFNKVFNLFNSDKHYDPSYFAIINRELLYHFFPNWILKLRRTKTKFIHEDYFKELKPNFKKYLYFWAWTVPIIVLPVPLAYPWLILAKVYRKIVKFFIHQYYLITGGIAHIKG